MKMHHSLAHDKSIAGTTGVCAYCNEEFRNEKSLKDRKYCSKECMIKKRKTEGMSEQWKINHQKAMDETDMTHTDEWRKQMSEMFTGRNITWGDKISETMSGREREDLKGPNNPNWAGGYCENYGDSWTQTLKREVRERDDNKCQVCGVEKTEYGRELDVHHIVPFRKFGLENHNEANKMENLVALCRSCHMSVEIGAVSLPDEKNKVSQ